MELQNSYSLLAPVYDAIVGRGSQDMRKASLASLAPVDKKSILLAGIGTGLDINHLPMGAHYTGIDITPAMLRRAKHRVADRTDIQLVQGNVMALPHADESFDHVVLHLILTVAPVPEKTLAEACRVLRVGGSITIVDKFLRPGERAPFRRLINPVLRRIATQTNIVFEPLLSRHPELHLLEDEPRLLGGWFRRILLTKTSA